MAGSRSEGSSEEPKPVTAVAELSPDPGPDTGVRSAKSGATAQERRRDLVRYGVVLLLAVVGVFTATGGIDGGAAWPVVGILLLIGALLVLPVSTASWDGIRKGVKSFSIGPVSAELISAAEEAPPVEDDGKALEDREFDVVGIQLKLESRLAYVVKHMLAPYDHPAGTQFATIGSLSYDRFLDQRDARLAAEVMTLRPADLEGMSATERANFLSGINKVVDNFRVSVLFALTKRIFADAGFEAEELPDRIRPLLKVNTGESSAILVVVFSTSRQSNSFKNSVRRLRTAAATQPQTDGLVIVVPDAASDAFKAGPPDGTTILRVGELASAFAL